MQNMPENFSDVLKRENLKQEQQRREQHTAELDRVRAEQEELARQQRNDALTALLQQEASQVAQAILKPLHSYAEFGKWRNRRKGWFLSEQFSVSSGGEGWGRTWRTYSLDAIFLSTEGKLYRASTSKATTANFYSEASLRNDIRGKDAIFNEVCVTSEEIFHQLRQLLAAFIVTNGLQV